MSLEVDKKEQILIEKLKVDKANGFSKLMWVLYKDTIKECMQLYADEMLQSKQSLDLKLVKIASVREHMDAHYRGEISYSKAVDLINDDANKQLLLHSVVGQSEQFYCVSSDALVYGKPCKKWCGDEHCKALCKQ